MSRQTLLLLAAWQAASAFRVPAPVVQRKKLLAPVPLKTPLRAAAADDAVAEKPPLVPRLAGFAALAAADEVCRVAFAGSGLPHSLAGGGALVALLIATGSIGEKLHKKLLAPGATLLLSWMPVFFAPALVLLPLALLWEP